MFRPNDHRGKQQSIDTTYAMNPRVKDAFMKSWAPAFYEDVFLRIDESAFEQLYSDNTGRPNFPINILVCLEFIKHIRNCSDEELLNSFHYDYQVSYAVGIRNIGEMSLSERTLYYFRKRVYRHCLESPNSENLLFKQFSSLTKAFADQDSIGMSDQRMDTTMFSSNIKKSSRIALIHDVLVLGVKAIPESKVSDNLKEVLEKSFSSKVLYRTRPASYDEHLTKLLDLCDEAFAILGGIETEPAEEARYLLSRLLDEQSTIDPKTHQRVPVANQDIASDSLQSAHDRDATFRCKGNIRQSGFIASVTETCGDDNPYQLITGFAVAPNITSDPVFAEYQLPILRKTGCEDCYLDGGFYSSDVLKAADDNNIQLHFTNMTGSEARTRMPLASFDINQDNYEICKCPMGREPERVSVGKDQTVAYFALGDCTGCPLFERCYSKTRKTHCVVRISLKSIRANRTRQDIHRFQRENSSKRAAIEGTNSALKRKGLDKLFVRGLLRSATVCGLKITAQNIKRHLRYQLGGYIKKMKKVAIAGFLCPEPAL